MNNSKQKHFNLKDTKTFSTKSALIDDQAIYVKSGNILERINIDEISCLQSDGNYCYIFAKDKKHVIKRSLVKIIDFLPRERFVRIHMRFIIALNKIDKVDLSKNVIHFGDKELAIGPRFRSELLQQLNIV